jgi:hypothetical protein
MFLEVKDAKYLKGFELLVEFNNGVIKTVDLSDDLDGEIFQPLKEISYFKNFSIKFNTIEWENGADFAPEYLYEKGIAASLIE